MFFLWILFLELALITLYNKAIQGLLNPFKGFLFDVFLGFLPATSRNAKRQTKRGWASKHYWHLSDRLQNSLELWGDMGAAKTKGLEFFFFFLKGVSIVF